VGGLKFYRLAFETEHFTQDFGDEVCVPV
jgi:hypothetical protein